MRNYTSLTDIKNYMDAPLDKGKSQCAYISNHYESRNRQRSQKQDTYKIAGKSTERETNIIGNLINGSPSRNDKGIDRDLSDN